MRAEWTKFRTIRGWVVSMALAAGAIVAFAVLPGMQGSCDRAACVLPTGPDGREVTDTFTFEHQPLTGDGSITARIAALTSEPAVPWAKAGLIVKDGTKPGSTYAAVMLTGAHGVRMQHDYFYDRPGALKRAPVWLRLTRSGDTVTAEESADGTMWTVVGKVSLATKETVEIGLFVTSPQHVVATGVASAESGPSEATAIFDNVSLNGQAWPDQTLTGRGDIGPAVAGASGIGTTVSQTLIGTFAGLILVVVVATMFAAGEYKRGMMRTTLALNPRRTRVLAAKAGVIAGVTFAAGLVGAAIAVVAGQDVLTANGVYVHPVPWTTEVRLVVGTAAMLATVAVLALALGFLLRRAAPAVTAAVAIIVLPYLLALTVVPLGASMWVLRISPAAAFAVQQSAERYGHVTELYTPANGFFPLPPWAGFAVLAGWAALALAAAAHAVRRRDV